MKEEQWKQYVIDELRTIREAVTTNSISVGKLNVKAGVWGLVGGLIPILILVGVELLTKKSPF